MRWLHARRRGSATDFHLFASLLTCRRQAAAMERQRSFRLEAELKTSRDELTDQRARMQAELLLS